MAQFFLGWGGREIIENVCFDFLTNLCETFLVLRTEQGMIINIYWYLYEGKCKGKGKGHPVTGHQGSRGTALLILDLGTRRGWVLSTTPRLLYPLERPGTHCTGGWVGTRATLDVCEKSRPHLGSIPRPSSL
jgi:hypothetical protein